MKLYIDPGTGSMLFTILIGLLGVLRYLFKTWIVKIRFFLSGGRKQAVDNDEIPLVIFSDDKRYWTIFKPICEELDRRGINIVYWTASADDPALNAKLSCMKAEFIGSGNKAFAKLNFLRATVLLSTTPGLDVYQWKRAREVKYYVHIPHAASDVSMYRMFGIDYYDALLLSGEYQVQQVREMEEIRSLPAKEMVKVGIPYMDEMLLRLKNSPKRYNAERTVLLAPSWGTSAILNRYGEQFIELLLKTGYHVIIRPHPQSFKSEKEMIDKIMNLYPDSDQLEWNRDTDNFDVLNRSDILISDFSGVMFDFALVYDKPIIYTDTQFDVSPYDAWWLKSPIWTFAVLDKLGLKLTQENMNEIKSLIDKCLTDERFANGRDEARSECWEHIGEGAVRTSDYLEQKIELLRNPKERLEE